MKLTIIIIFSLTISSCNTITNNETGKPNSQVLVNYPKEIDSLVYFNLLRSIEYEEILHFESEVKHPIIRKSKQHGGRVEMGDWEIDYFEYIAKASIIFTSKNNPDTKFGIFSINDKYEILWQEVN